MKTALRLRTSGLVALPVMLALAMATCSQTLFKTHDQACDCDPARPETMQARQCGLCREAEAQPPGILFFFLKDSNPRKPNRWLILPRAHSAGMHSLKAMSAADAATFWSAAAEKGRSIWDAQWALAVNGDRTRTQCHAHVHLGKLIESAEGEDYLFRLGASPVAGKPVTVVPDIAHVQIPQNGEGFWIHPAGSGLHVHVEDASAACEFVLAR